MSVCVCVCMRTGSKCLCSADSILVFELGVVTIIPTPFVSVHVCVSVYEKKA